MKKATFQDFSVLLLGDVKSICCSLPWLVCFSAFVVHLTGVLFCGLKVDVILCSSFSFLASQLLLKRDIGTSFSVRLKNERPRKSDAREVRASHCKSRPIGCQGNELTVVCVCLSARLAAEKRKVERASAKEKAKKQRQQVRRHVCVAAGVCLKRRKDHLSGILFVFGFMRLLSPERASFLAIALGCLGVKRFWKHRSQ